jgi:polysaccharide biosynthesis/export protein PslD
MSAVARRIVGGVLAAFLVVACAQPAVLPPPSPPPILDYVIEVGDVLGVRVPGQRALDERVTVGPDGRIEMAPIGTVMAAGQTVGQVDAAISEQLARYVRAPRVTVFVRKFANLNVYVGGEVKRPGLVPLRSGMTSLMALFAAGGFRDTGQKDQVVILRDSGAGRARIHTIDARAVLAGSVPDLVLQPYDVIFVPMSTIARVDLAVEQYIRRMLPFNLFANASYSWIKDEAARSPSAVTIIP